MQAHSERLKVAGAVYAAPSLQLGGIVCVWADVRECVCVCEVYRSGHFTQTLAMFRFFSRSVWEVQSARQQQQLNYFSLPLGISDNTVSPKKTHKKYTILSTYNRDQQPSLSKAPSCPGYDQITFTCSQGALCRLFHRVTQT